jgi:hypothetical protein
LANVTPRSDPSNILDPADARALTSVDPAATERLTWGVEDGPIGWSTGRTSMIWPAPYGC